MNYQTIIGLIVIFPAFITGVLVGVAFTLPRQDRKQEQSTNG